VWIDNAKFVQHGVRLGLTGEKTPAFVIDDYRNNKRFIYPEASEFSFKAVTDFVSEYLEGKVKPFVKSEPVPESNDGPVTTVVSTTFLELVNDPSKNVLIEFYAPWCGHCKKLAPIFEELGEKFQGEESVRIAKFDATANDVPIPLEIKGYPTLYLFPAGDKDHPVEYQGPRELENLYEFVRTQSGLTGTDDAQTFEQEEEEHEHDHHHEHDEL